MFRENIINEIMTATGETDASAFEKYSTSDLKKILNDALTVRVATDNSINGTIVLIGIFALLIVYLTK